MMTPRERLLAVYNGEPTDRTPTVYGATGEFSKRLSEHVGAGKMEQVYRRLDIDQPHNVGPKRCPDRPMPPDGMWGVRHQQVDYGTGAYNEGEHSPPADAETPADVHRHPWPDPDDWDCSTIPAQIDENAGYRFVHGGSYQPMPLLCDRRGPEQTFLDFALNPQIIEAILSHLFEVRYEMNRRILEAGAGRIDGFFVSADLGSQLGPLISLERHRRFFRPGHREMAALAHDYGAKVPFHSDGAIGVFLDDLIDVVGIDALIPIQWRAEGMERERLGRLSGARCVMHGAIDNQQTLPFGTPEEVAAELRETRDTFADRRWICGPCHNIRANTPPENIVAMYETACRFR